MADRSTAALGRKPPMSGLGPAPDTRSGRGYLARSDQGRHLSSLKSASRLARGLTAAGVGIVQSDFITPV